MSKIGEDCYFFIKASCRNGDNCTFRHCKDALLTQDTCKEWIAGQCQSVLCPKRHPQLSTTPICKFENSPTGCLNRNCTFRHVKSRGPTKLPTALAEVLKQSAPVAMDTHLNGNQSTLVTPTNLKRRMNTPQLHTITNKPSPIIVKPQQFTPKPVPKPVSPPLLNIPSFKPQPKPNTSEMESPAPIPTITLRSETDGHSSHHSTTSTALMSNLKVLTTHSDAGYYDRRNNVATDPMKRPANSDPLRSPPSPITFQDKPKRPPITFNSDTRITQHVAIVPTADNRNAVDATKKRPRTLTRNNSNSIGPSPAVNSPLGETAKPPVKRVKIRVRRKSSLLQLSPVDQTTHEEAHTTVSPVLSPLESGAYHSFSSDDFRIEDQIEDLINANFSPKHSQMEQIDIDDPEIQDTDDIFLEFENLIS